jgi:hypothetical protein
VLRWTSSKDGLLPQKYVHGVKILQAFALSSDVHAYFLHAIAFLLCLFEVRIMDNDNGHSSGEWWSRKLTALNHQSLICLKMDGENNLTLFWPEWGSNPVPSDSQ